MLYNTILDVVLNSTIFFFFYILHLMRKFSIINIVCLQHVIEVSTHLLLGFCYAYNVVT